MAKKQDAIVVSEDEFTLMPQNPHIIDLSVELAKLGWTAEKVVTRDLVGHTVIIKDYKRVEPEGQPERYYFYCAIYDETDQRDICSIMGGSQIKEYLERCWEFDPRCMVRFKLGFREHKADRAVYFIDAPDS